LKLYTWNKKGTWKLCSPKDVVVEEKDFFTTWATYADDYLLESGAMAGNFVMDFDCATIDHSRQDTMFIYDKLLGLGIDKNSIIILFSGSKGFHLEVDCRTFLKAPIYSLPEIYKYIAEFLADDSPYQTWDKVIYSGKRMWRYPNTIHSKTGLYCTYITPEELKQSVEAIKNLAKIKQQDKRTNLVTKDEGFSKLMKMGIEKTLKDIEMFSRRVSYVTFNEKTQLPCIDRLLKEGAIESCRNNTLYILACYFKKKGKTNEEAIELLKEWAAKNSLSDKEAETTITSAYRSSRDGIGCRNSILSDVCDRNKCSINKEVKKSNDQAYLEENFTILNYNEGKKLVNEREAAGFYKRYIKTNIFGIDKFVDIRRDAFIVIGANTSIGKSTFLSTLANNFKDQNKKILYFSLEENIDSAIMRLMKMDYSVDKDKFIIAKPNKGLMRVDDIEKFVNIYSPDIILLDQMTWLDYDKAKEERIKYREITKKLYSFTQSASPIPVIVLHQLNRAALTQDRLPGKENLAEGADIERMASNVWILSRLAQENGNKITCLHIDKNRWGASDKLILLRLNVDKLKFEEISSNEIEELKGKITSEEAKLLINVEDYRLLETENVKVVREFFS